MLLGNKQKSIVHILESLFFMHYTDIVLAFTNQFKNYDITLYDYSFPMT